MISIKLTADQCREATVWHIATTLIIHKQYMDDSMISKYKYMLGQFAILSELDEIAARFDRAFPTDVKWGIV